MALRQRARQTVLETLGRDEVPLKYKLCAMLELGVWKVHLVVLNLFDDIDTSN